MNPVWIVFGLIALLLAYEFVQACRAEYRQSRESDLATAADDEWLARQHIAPLSSTVDRVWTSK